MLQLLAMPHTVTLDDDFPDCLMAMLAASRDPEAVQEQVGSILSGLEGDEYFIPAGPEFDDEYVYERIDEGVVCKHIQDWGKWQLVFTYSYSYALPSIVEDVTVSCLQQEDQYLRAR